MRVNNILLHLEQQNINYIQMRRFTLSFFIKTSSGDRSKTVKIRARLSFGRGNIQVTDTPLMLRIGLWDTEKQKAKQNSNAKDYYKFDDRVVTDCNDKLNNLRAHLEQRINAELLTDNNLPAGWLQNEIERYFNPEKFENKPKTLFTFIDEFILKAETRIKPKTGKAISYKMIREYSNTYRFLKEFAEHKGKEPNFEDIDLEFYDEFMTFLQSCDSSLAKKDKATGKLIKLKLATNTIGKKIQTLKIFLNDATERGVNTNLKFKSHKFTVVTEETDSFHLDIKELDKFYKHDFAADLRLERVRDLFIVGCWTGLRFSDLSHLTPQSIKNGFFHVIQQKTLDKVVIPVHPIVSEIMRKYSGKLPPSISNQKFNEYLQEAAGIAGIDTEIHKGITRGGVRISKKFPKHVLLGSHCMRRSFATNMYESGFPAHSIMQITGHKTESAFLKYLKTSPEKHAKMLMEHWLKNMDHLKVV